MSQDALVPADPLTFPANPIPLDQMSKPERDAWRATGVIPSAPSADSPPAVPATPAASTDASSSPASEPGKPKKANAETRLAELLPEHGRLKAEHDRLRSELDALKRPAKSDAVAESSPAAGRPLDDLLASPDVSRAALSEAEFFAAYPTAGFGEFTRYTSRYEIAADRAVTAQRQTVRARETSFQEKYDQAVKADPTFVESLDPRIADLRPIDSLRAGERPGPMNVIAQEILESPIPAQIMAHLSAHPEELDRLAALPFPALLKAMGRLEAQLDAPAPPRTTQAVSTAPPPPKTLGTKNEVPADPVAGAIADGDFARYKREQNARDVAAAR